jgi:hypothetical protein
MDDVKKGEKKGPDGERNDPSADEVESKKADVNKALAKNADEVKKPLEAKRQDPKAPGLAPFPNKILNLEKDGLTIEDAVTLADPILKFSAGGRLTKMPADCVKASH